MQMLFSFCEMYKGNSDQLLNLFSDGRGESAPNAIIHFIENLPRFTLNDFPSHFQLSRSVIEVAIMNHWLDWVNFGTQVHQRHTIWINFHL